MPDDNQQPVPSDRSEGNSSRAADEDADTTSDSDADTTSDADEASLVESREGSDDMARLQEELAALKSTVASLLAEVRGGAAKTLRAAGDMVSHRVEAASQVAVEKGSSLVETASERAQGLASELETWARRRPLSAIAGAMLAGILIGMLGRRRS